MTANVNIKTVNEKGIVKGDAKAKSVQRTARFAGLLYMIITVFAILAHIYLPSQLIVEGDGAATVANLQNSPALFRVGMVGSELILLLCEVILSVVLFVLLKPVNKIVSGLAAVSRLVMTTIHGLNLINYFFVILLTSGTATMAAFNAEQIQDLVMLFLNVHGFGFTIGIAFLTIHVFTLGYLVFKSGYFPKVLGILFIAAGAGYLFDSFSLLLNSTYTTTPGIVAAVISISELAFPLWLLIKGVNLDGWSKRIAEAE